MISRSFYLQNKSFFDRYFYTIEVQGNKRKKSEYR